MHGGILKYVGTALQFKKIFFISWSHHMACGILVPQPGITPATPAVEMRSLNHWTTKEVFTIFVFLFIPALLMYDGQF